MISSDNFEYIGFWKRVLAALIDGLIGFALMPVSIPLMKFCFAHKTVLPELAFSIVWTVFWLWLVVRFGATPGKMVIKARIINGKGEFLNWDKAFLRMLFPGLLISINSHVFHSFEIPDKKIRTNPQFRNQVKPFYSPLFP